MCGQYVTLRTLYTSLLLFLHGLHYICHVICIQLASPICILRLRDDESFYGLLSFSVFNCSTLHFDKPAISSTSKLSPIPSPILSLLAPIWCSMR